MIIRTILDGNVKKYFNSDYTTSENGFPVKLVNSKAQTELFTLIGSGGSSWIVDSNVYWPGKENFVPDLNKKVEIRLLIGNAAFNRGSYFDFEGVKYVGGFDVTGNNVYTIFGGPEGVAESIAVCFEKTGVLDDWDFSWVTFNEVSQIDSQTYGLLSIRLVRKTPGDYKITSRMKLIEDVKRNIYINNELNINNTPQLPYYTGHHYNGFWNPNNYFDYLGPDFISMIIEDYSLSNKAFDNFDYYELGCKITPGGGDKPIVLSKKLVDLADFNITSVIRNYPTYIDSSGLGEYSNLTPRLGSLLFESISITRTFKVDFYQGYIDINIPNNNYINKVYDKPIEIVPNAVFEDRELVVKMIGESWNRTYEKHIPNKFLDTNYNFNDDYWGVIDLDRYPFGVMDVPLQLLTNQPNYKKMNKTYENLYMLDGFNVNSKLEINITYNDDTKIVSTYSAFHYGRDKSNHLVFKTDQWDTSTQSVSRVDINYLYGVQNPGTSSTDIGYITYSQTYYRDPLDTSCDGLDEDDDVTTIMFKNQFGVFDIFEFEETSEFNLDRKIDIFTKTPTWQDMKTSNFDSILKMDLTKTYKTTTRILDDEEWVWLEELVRSEDIYVVVDETPYPIIITDISYGSQKNVDKKITMTYRFSRPE